MTEPSALILQTRAGVTRASLFSSITSALAFAFYVLPQFGCGPYMPPTTVPVVQPGLDPFRQALKQYIDATQPFRRQAAAEGASVPNQTGAAPNAEEAIRVRERTMAEAIRTKVRPGAAQGAIFSPAAADVIRQQIAAAFNSPKVDLIRDELEEQNEGYRAEGAPLKINAVFVAPRVPPLLRSILPQLPEQVEFDFQDRTLVLRDVDANIVVDYIPDALPERAPPPAAVQDTTKPQPPSHDQVLPVPDLPGGIVFAALGDSGSGNSSQYQVADAMLRYFTNSRRFSFVLMLGDNLYHDDYTNEFLTPYKELLDRGVMFYAALGNHDRELQRHFKPFNMNDRQYYAFNKGNARFVVLDSNQPTDPVQMKWLEAAYGDTGNKWRIAYFHHPLYSSGEHAEQSRDVIRPALEPALVRNKVDVAFAGHEHLYERIAAQQNVRYFVSGGGGRSLYSIQRSPFDEAAVSAHHFMILALAGDQLFFEAVTPQGRMLDCGLLWRTKEAEAKGADSATRAWLEACAAALKPAETTNQQH
jgi:hypothetical protein